MTVALAADFTGQIDFDGGRYTAVHGTSDFGPTTSGLVRGSLGIGVRWRSPL
jgi:outer membrane protein assembly factor BamA